LALARSGLPVSGRVSFKMLKRVSKESAPAALPELDFYSLPQTQVGVLSTRFVEVGLLNTLTENAPLEFRVYNSAHCLNLQRSYLWIKFKIVNADGSSIH
jgi:hypothetical protein